MITNQKIDYEVKDGVVFVVTTTNLMDGEAVIATGVSRRSIAPGDDYANEQSEIQSLCSLVHTQERIAAYQAASILL